MQIKEHLCCADMEDQDQDHEGEKEDVKDQDEIKRTGVIGSSFEGFRCIE